MEKRFKNLFFRKKKQSAHEFSIGLKPQDSSFLQSYFQFNPLCSLLFNDEGKAVDANQAALNFFRLPAEELEGKLFHQIFINALNQNGETFSASDNPVVNSFKHQFALKDVPLNIIHPSYQERTWLILSTFPVKTGDIAPFQSLIVTFQVPQDQKPFLFKNKREDETHSGHGTHRSVRFEDMFDLDEIQKLQDLFAEATGVASLITSPEGEPITRPSNFCHLCENIIRKTKKGAENCSHSDSILGRPKLSGPSVSHCLSGGLWDAGASIVVEGNHVANWLIGQVLDDSHDIDRMLAYADEIGANPEEFRKALEQVPHMPYSRFKVISDMLFKMSNMLSGQAFQKFQLQRLTQEQNQLLQKLEESSTLLNSVFEQSPVGMILGSSKDKRILKLNAAAKEFLQISEYKKNYEENILSYKAYQLNGEEMTLETTPFYRSLCGFSTIGQRTKIVRKDGSEIFLQENAIPIFDSNGKQIAGFSVTVDVTREEHALKKLRINEQNFKQLTYYIPAMIYARNIEGRYIFANEKAAEAFGITADELQGQRLQDIHPNSLQTERILESDRYVIHSNESIEISEQEFTDIYGNQIILHSTITPYTTVDTGEKCALGISIDISRLKETEKELRKNRENLRITLDSIGDGVISTDMNGRIIQMNPVAQKITGWPLQEVIYTPLKEIFPIYNKETKERIQDPVEHVLSSGKLIGLTKHSVLINREGKEIQIADSGAPIKNDDGEIVGVVLVFRDVTEEYQLEEQIRQSQKMDSIGKLAGGIAHDFNNMLTGILGFGDLLLMLYGNDAKGSRYIQEIVNIARRASELTGKLLTFARKKKTPSKIIDMNQLILETISLVEHSIDKMIEVHSDLSAIHFKISGDYAEIQNDVLNLCVNARDAMPDGGVMKICTRDAVLDQDFCKNSPFEIEPGEYFELIVSDTGIGMQAQVLEKIFEPFFTTKEAGKGTGLGLSTVFGSVRGHRGAIRVESKVGKGTKFHLYFPISNEALQAEEEKNLQTIQGHGRILVIDDEETIRMTLKLLLESLGYQVDLKENGREGLNFYTEFSDQIDLVILDIVMPVMGGKECLRELKKLNPNAKILISSGYTRGSSVDELSEMGISGFLAKPYKKEELSQAVFNAIHS